MVQGETPNDVEVCACVRLSPGESCGGIMCKIWYSIHRTVSDAICIAERSMIARCAHSPSSPAPPARRFAADGLDRYECGQDGPMVHPHKLTD
jgi:hypothetical protein